MSFTLFEPDSGHSSRLSLYKAANVDGQEKRRNELLENQERQREKLLDSHRQLLDNIVQKKKSNLNHKGFRLLGKMLMLSEWLIQPPEDFESSWVFMFCPVGRRCIVRAHKGTTVAVTKGGKLLVSFSSPLPGGGIGQGSSPAVTTILDCIYHEPSSTFYVMDVLHWNDLPMIGTQNIFRQFWMRARISEELSWVSEKSSKVKYPLICLESYPCSLTELETRLTNYPYFLADNPKVDGILFYHKDAYYIQGNTPLVGWLKPFMIPEVFGTSVSVAVNYNIEKPENYSGYLDYMVAFDSEVKSRRTRKVVGDVDMAEVLSPESDSFERVDDCENDLVYETSEVLEEE